VDPTPRPDVAPNPLAKVSAALLPRLLACCHEHYGARLVSLVVFGSVGRGTAGPESDLDLLVVAAGLPDGRVPRVQDFEAVEQALATDLALARRQGWAVEISPVFKTPAEVAVGSPLFLDMVDDAALLFDRDGFMQQALEQLRQRLNALGARRIWRGNAWFWDLKPDYRPGEVFEI
jgi:uncharacterized protein